jgi:cytochrome b involved in lipid metabolism
VDFTEFRHRHPGGKFLLDKNHGKDISKYFHGGYASESSKVSIQGHKHSNYAIQIVKTLIVARLCEKDIIQWQKVNKQTSVANTFGQNVSQFEFKGP